MSFLNDFASNAGGSKNGPGGAAAEGGGGGLFDNAMAQQTMPNIMQNVAQKRKSNDTLYEAMSQYRG